MKFLSNTQLFHLMGKQDKYTPYRRTSKTEYSSTALELKNLSPFLLDFVKNQTIGRKPQHIALSGRASPTTALSVLPGMAYLCAMNEQMLDIIGVHHSEQILPTGWCGTAAHRPNPSQQVFKLHLLKSLTLSLDSRYQPHCQQS